MSTGSVLVVDDDAGLRSVLSDVLEAAGFSVRIARNGVEALELLRDLRPDVALVDVRMPQLSGDQLLAAARAEGHDCAFILMTAHADVASAASAVQHRAFGYLQKPFELDLLLSTVDHAASLRRLERDNRRMVADLQAREEQLERAVAQAEARAAELDALYTVTRTSSGSLARPEVASTSLRTVATLLRCEAELLLADEGRGVLVPEARERAPELPDGAPVSGPGVEHAIGDGLVGSVLRDTQPRFAAPEAGEGRLPAPALEGSWPAFAAVPLVSRGRSLGVLALGRAEPFGEAERALLPRVAAVLAVGLENALLFERANAAVESLRSGQSRMLENERLAVVGQLAAGVAHEINNPCAVVLANLHLLRLQLDGLDEIASRPRVAAESERAAVEQARLLSESRQLVEDSVAGGERIRNIVRDLRTFGRGARDAPQPTDLHQLLDSTLAMLRGELTLRARVEKHFGALPLIEAHPGRLGQALLHLLMNAFQSIPEGEPARHVVEVSTAVDAERWAVIRVRDTGAGIPAELLTRVFEPYFTTKPPGQGSGLGLSVALDIVRHLGGEMRLESEPGRGTTVEVRLPLPPPRARVDVATATATEARTRRRVLVVDDEPRVLRAFARLIGREHEVVTAEGGVAALELLDADQAFDFVLCDLVMPGVGGIEVFEALRSRHPALVGRFAVVTGGAFNDRTRAFLERERPPVLEKPFTLDDVRRLFGATAG